MRRVTLYTRAGCHLCDDAAEVLDGVRAQHPFTLDVVDITSDAALLARYRTSIPVVCVDGVEAFRFRVDGAALRALVAETVSA